MAVGNFLRKLANWLIPVLLTFQYLMAMFIDPTPFVGDLSPTVPGTDPKATWAGMSPTARGLGPQLAGWAICYCIIMAGFMTFENTERTHQLMSRINAFIMLVWWPIVWYGAMLPKEDYSGIDATVYFYQMSIAETIMGIIYLALGFLVPADKTKLT
ncbi:hypothetical protein CYMTET_12889 [Cymbomonas tetramitiformis]|uniref:Uncharacterized protein n=1 Tax=Cymbomonas tetramitiformis TaxID=36881 RepID=A0AAE0GKS8_9CHLO|nr:hypothetical protein CYMTET_12889 [Cymbomonas tetramitiformis]|eukprot:gene21527-25891_t